MKNQATNKYFNLEGLGYNQKIEQYRKENSLQDFGVGRVISEHKERYMVKTTTGDCEAEIIGNMRYTSSSRADFPAVGDWVAISEYDENKALIHAVFDRETVLQRKAAGKISDVQIIAANIDVAFIVQSVNRDFNLNRLERYLAICYESGITPIIIISKIDLISETHLDEILKSIRERNHDLNLLAISNVSNAGIDELNQYIEKGKTYCMLGSSGVGKSTLINSLAGHEVMSTGEIGAGTDRGKHVTTHRELIVLENGGVFIDNPGMREVGMTEVSAGLDETFDIISAFAKDCRYQDCTHLHESACAVLHAVENGEIDEGLYENFVKLQKERMHFESNLAEKKQKGKELSKRIKTFKKNKF